MVVEIPFQERWRAPILEGTKTCTSRTKRYAEVGDTFEAFGAIFQLTAIERRYLKDVAEVLFAKEGCKSPDEFEYVWEQLHPRRGWQAYERVWLHHLKIKK